MVEMTLMVQLSVIVPEAVQKVIDLNVQVFLCSISFLSLTELAPLRAPLIPMEHCTPSFFEQCDADQDKYIALEEWANCFGIKEREFFTMPFIFLLCSVNFIL